MSSSGNEVARCRAELIRLYVDVFALRNIDVKRALIGEISLALDQLSSGDSHYARELIREVRPVIAKQRWASIFGISPPESAIGILLSGVLIYSVFVVLMLGPCVVVVQSLKAPSSLNLFTSAAQWLGLMPVFQTVMALGITPPAYLYGLLGGAGAVVSLVKRFDSFSTRSSSFWLLFATGLFSPIVGSLRALVVCDFIYATDKVKVLQVIPHVVVAFFAGFSERLLAGVGRMVGFESKGKDTPAEGKSV
jgi:hypothetical protein